MKNFLKKSALALGTFAMTTGAMAQEKNLETNAFNSFKINPQVDTVLTNFKTPTLTVNEKAVLPVSKIGENKEKNTMTGDLAIDSQNLSSDNTIYDLSAELNKAMKNTAKAVAIETANNNQYQKINDFLYTPQR